MAANTPKQIVYLLGAGATQAEVDYLGAARVNLLMRDSEEIGEGLSTAILARLGSSGAPFTTTEHAIDIEKLISLLGANGVNSQSRLAERMRKAYFEEIHKRLIKAKIIRRPGLAIALCQMHRNDRFHSEVEQLRAIFTTNHDGLLQLAFQSVFGGIDVGFPFASEELDSPGGSTLPLLLQLHGSFAWSFSLPIKITTLRRESKYSANTVWIPPTVLKESKTYPFNKLTALAYEILAKRCDVLRIVGSSLTQNDWNILGLIFNAQRHRELTHGVPFRIELIVSSRGGADIQAACSYLKHTVPISFLTEGDFTGYSDEIAADSDLGNVFAYWLRQKIIYHRRRGEFDETSRTDEMEQLADGGL
jgi:hypothetical protein